MIKQTKMKSKLIILFFGTVLFFGSCNKSPKVADKTELQCPMKCEGDKVYKEEGTCPVCKMDLKPTSKPSKNRS